LSELNSGHTQTTAASHPVGIDIAAVTAWLADHLADLQPPLTFARIGEGQSNLTYRVHDRDRRSVVLRRPPTGPILPSAHDMAREYRILSGLASADMPVPRPLALCEDAAVTGAVFYAMEHVNGLVLNTAEVAEQLTPAARNETGLSMMRTLARLQSTDLEASGLSDLRRPGSYASRQLRRWRRQWEASRTRERPLVDRLADRLEAHLPEETEATVVHGDFHPLNTIVGPEGTVRAVVDWELCTVGDPLGDLGLTIAYWNELGRPAASDRRLFREPITDLPGFPDVAALVAEYERASERDLSHLPFWVSFAYWKIAIIAEGVYRRWLDNPALGTDPEHLGAAVDRLVTLADRAAGEAGI
jgi:aminoglycoside phosphotransferase (APT) family kinase protein